MKNKRRFGVSVPSEIATQLDKVATFGGIDRSTIVAKALEEYLHEDLHSTEEHICSGLMVYLGALSIENIDRPELQRLIRYTCTVRLRGGLITILFVEGSFKDIISLREKLSKRPYKKRYTRYVPIYCSSIR